MLGDAYGAAVVEALSRKELEAMDAVIDNADDNKESVKPGPDEESYFHLGLSSHSSLHTAPAFPRLPLTTRQTQHRQTWPPSSQPISTRPTSSQPISTRTWSPLSDVPTPARPETRPGGAEQGWKSSRPPSA